MLELRLLGPVGITGADRREVRGVLAQPRRLALLAYLAAATPRGMHRRDSLAALFWPDLDQGHARGALRQALYVLRTTLGPDAIVSRGDEEVGLAFDALVCDVVAFDEAEATGRFAEALDAYRGQLLEGFYISSAPAFEEWLEAERGRRHLIAARAAQAMITRAESDRDLVSAVRWARDGVRLAPHDEAAARRLMSVLLRAGDRAGAVQVYRDLAKRLATDYEVTPAAETDALLESARVLNVTSSPNDAAAVLQSMPATPGAFVRTTPSADHRWRTPVLALLATCLVLGVTTSAGRTQRSSAGEIVQSARMTRQLPITNSAEAYDLFSRAKFHFRHETRSDDSVAIVLLERAVALDPSFAAAFAYLGRAYALRALQFAPEDSNASERALVAADKALRLDPDLAEAHYARGMILWGPRNHFTVEFSVRELRRAIELDPNLDDAHHQLGVLYLHIGLLDKAVAELEKTLALDPRNSFAQHRIGVALVDEGRYEEGLRTLRAVPSSFNPALWYYHVTWALLYLNRDEEASKLIDEYLVKHPEDRGGVVTSIRAILHAKHGDTRGAEQDIKGAQALGAGYVHFHHTEYNIASAYALMRRPRDAVHWLRRAADDGWPCYPYFARDPNLDNVRNDPEVVALLAELKVQWERYRATL